MSAVALTVRMPDVAHLNRRKMIKQFRFKQSDICVFNHSARQVADRVDKNSRVMGLTRGEYSLIDIIHAILQKIGKANVACVTWSAGIKDAYQVKWMCDTDLINSFTLITDHSYATRQRKYVLAITDLFGEENIRTSEIHAKFTLIWNDDWKICIRHSMNLNANRTCESFEIDEGDEVFDFYMDFVEYITQEQKVGFESRNFVVNKTLDNYFQEKQEPADYSFFKVE